MAHVDRVPLGAGTVVRKYFLDINTGTYSSPTWTPVDGISAFKFSGHKPEMRDDSDWDSMDGSTSQIKTGYAWDITCTVQRKRTTASAVAYDVGQEALRTAASAVLSSAIVDIRFYEVNEQSGPISESYRGYAVATWAPAGGQKNELDAVEVTLTGRGALSATTHPDYAATVPTVTSLAPATGLEAGGELIEVHGTGFFLAGVDDVTNVDFGTEAATIWITESDNVLFVIAPAKSAGTVAVKVTNAAGAATVTSNYVYTAA